MSKANQKVMRAKKLNICTSPVESLVYFYRRSQWYDLTDFSSYKNHNIVLLLAVLAPVEIPFTIYGCRNTITPEKWKAVVDLSGVEWSPEQWPGYSLTHESEIENLEEWLLENSKVAPRVLRVCLFAAFCNSEAWDDIKYVKIINYINSDFNKEIEDFIFNESHSLYLREFALRNFIRHFKSFPELKITIRKIKKYLFGLYLLHPILYIFYVKRFQSLIEDLLQYKNEPAFFYFIENNSLEESYKNSSMIAQEKLFNEFFSTVVIAEKKDLVPNAHYVLDRDFYNRMKKEAHLLRNINNIELALLANNQSIGIYLHDDNYPYYKELVNFLRSNGFDFEGDDPLGIKDLIEGMIRIYPEPEYDDD